MNDDVAIKVEKLHKTFHEQAGSKSFKEVFVNIGNRIAGKKEKRLNKGDFVALKDINFEVKKGEFFGIVGRNGSGKSTLLKTIAGVYAPNVGSIQINGKLTPFIELGVGFNPELSGKDNVYLNSALLGFTRKQTDVMYDDIVRFAELEEFMDMKLKNYSSGMQVRLAFSVAIRAESDILLIDEVLAVGDASFQKKCFDYFEDLKEQSKTVVFVTHDMSSVRKYCTRAIYIKQGSIIKQGSASAIADYYTEENIVAVDDTITQYEIDVTQSDKANLKASLTKDSKGIFNLSVDIKTTEEDLYVAISVIRDNMAIAEATSEKEVNISRDTKVSYYFDPSSLICGTYYITVALFRAEDRKWVASYEKQIKFVVKDFDSSRSGYLRLPKGWKSD